MLGNHTYPMTEEYVRLRAQPDNFIVCRPSNGRIDRARNHLDTPLAGGIPFLDREG